HGVEGLSRAGTQGTRWWSSRSGYVRGADVSSRVLAGTADVAQASRSVVERGGDCRVGRRQDQCAVRVRVARSAASGRGASIVNAIECHQVGKRFGRVWALRDCTLAIPEGRVAALVGPNGAGK